MIPTEKKSNLNDQKLLRNRDEMKEIREELKYMKSFMKMQVEESKAADAKLEGNYSELKLKYEEVSELLKILTDKYITLDEKIKALRVHLDNGWRGEFITDLTSRVLSILENNAQNSYQLESQKSKEKNDGKLKWIGLFALICSASWFGDVISKFFDWVASYF